MLIADLDVRAVHVLTGEPLRDVTRNPTGDHRPQTRKQAGP